MNRTSINGLEICYRVTEGNEPLTVFVHGAGGSSGVWSKQQDGLDGLVKTVAIDLPGHGFSSGNAFSDITDYAKLIANFIPETKPFVIVGHSMGGAIAMELSLTFPNRLLGMVLVCTGAKLKVDPNILESLTLGKVPTGMLERLFGDSYRYDTMQKIIGEMNKVSPHVYQADFLACNKFNRVNDLRRINIPVQIIAGEEDIMTPLKFAEFLNQNISNSKLVTIKGAGHMCMLEKPHEVTNAILDFLKNL
ncbi:MAG TPA: alpha/beta hydrolase [Candidatus Deferrimicrobium sp.]|nr:alpha/beta hydrolase [Candidatus Deferrimicrobium sp.]